MQNNTAKQIKTYSVMFLIVGILSSVVFSLNDLTVVIKGFFSQKTLYIVNLGRGLGILLGGAAVCVLLFFLMRAYSRLVQKKLEADITPYDPTKLGASKIFEIIGKGLAVIVDVAWWLFGIMEWGTASTTEYLVYLIILIVPVAISIWFSACLVTGIGELMECASHRKAAA